MPERRLVFDEFFMFLVGVRRLKEHRGERHSDFVMVHSREADKLKERLPYALTRAQERTLQEVYRDMENGLVMNRLIQGDVGSGKTIIAILAAFWRRPPMDTRGPSWFPRRCWQGSILSP